MTHRGIGIAMAIAGLTVAAPAALANGFESLEVVASGSQTLIPCEGVQEPAPGGGGYTVPAGQCLVSTVGDAATGFGQNPTGITTSSVTVNGAVVAFIDELRFDKSGTNEYIIAQRLRINGTGAYTANGETENFEVNDLFKSGFSVATNRSVAYTPVMEPDDGENNGIEGLWLAGFTEQGLNEYSGSPYGLSPLRSSGNDVINFRTDVSGFDPDGDNRAQSSWFILKFTAPNVATTPAANVVRVRQGGEEDQDPLDVTTSGYQPSAS